METYIKDLKLSPEVKTALSWCLGITKVSDLEGLNYLTFANRCPKNYNVLAIADELNALGYLYPPENEISVNDISMSRRLQNVLIRNNILYLSQLSLHPREEILKFRNMGESTMPELDSICQKYGIQIHSLASVKEAFELMKHMDENDMVILSVVNRKTYVHSIPRRIKKKSGEELIKNADNICYQDNDFFGTLSLYGVLQEKDTIHNILFPQLE